MPNRSAAKQNVTVNYAVAGGTADAGRDFDAITGTPTFAPGQTSKTISVAVRGDLIDEYDETLYVNLSGAAGAVIADGQGVGTILDNDPPPNIVISDVTAQEGRTRTKPYNFTVSLSAASEKAVIVNYATANGTAKTTDSGCASPSGSGREGMKGAPGLPDRGRGDVHASALPGAPRASIPRHPVRAAGLAPRRSSAGGVVQPRPPAADGRCVHPLVSKAGLTPRERQALRHLLKGRSEAEAARLMGVGVSTLHTYAKGIYRKFRVRSRPRLMAKFLAHIKV